MISVFKLALVSFLLELCSAIPGPLPAPTVANMDHLLLGWTPRPTEGPSLEMMKKRGIYARQASLSSGQLIGYFAPDATCGYISGSIGNSVPCSTGSRCAALANIGNIPGAVGCCPTANGNGNCYFITTCYNSVDVPSKCDQGCQQDADVRLCTQSASPFCFGYTWPDISATIWGCAPTSVATKATVLFTYVGEGTADGRSWSPAFYTPTTSGVSASNTNPLQTAVSSRVSGSLTSSSASSSPTQAPAKKNTNIGAIVGGVVGGIAVIAAFAVGVLFIITRRRKQHAKDTTIPSTDPAAAHYDPSMQQHHSPAPGSAIPGAAGSYYGGNEPKAYNHPQSPQYSNMSELGATSPSPGYAQPINKDGGQQHLYAGASQNPHRVSAFSEHGGSPLPPYSGGEFGQQPGPMELDGSHPVSQVAPHSHQSGPIYEAPEGAPRT